MVQPKIRAKAGKSRRSKLFNKLLDLPFGWVLISLGSTAWTALGSVAYAATWSLSAL